MANRTQLQPEDPAERARGLEKTRTILLSALESHVAKTQRILLQRGRKEQRMRRGYETVCRAIARARADAGGASADNVLTRRLTSDL